MANGITIKVSGTDDVVRALQSLGIDVANGLEAICDAGAAVVQDAIKANAPGEIAAEVVRETTTKSRKRVTVSTGPSKDAFYARFLEYGVSPHKITATNAKALIIGADLFRKSVNHPGHAAQPFVRPAFDGTKDQAEDKIAGEIRQKVRQAGR